VVDQHLRGPATFHVFVETLVDEVLEFRRPLRRNSGRLILYDVKEDASVMLTDVGRLSLRQLDGEDAEGPHIDLVIVLASAFYKLGCHPAHGSYFRLATLLLLGQNHSVAEVSKFDLSVGLDEDVV
jgi:hypothetical protein